MRKIHIDVAALRQKLTLAELKKRLQIRSVLALTLESNRLVVSGVRRVEDRCQTAPPIFVPVGAEAICKNPEKAGETLAAALAEAGLRERRCVVCVPPGWALTASTDLPEVSPEDRRAYLELQAEREFPIPPANLRLGYSAYHLPDGKQRATLAAVPAKRLEAVEKMLAAAGCRAISISLALEHCLAGDSPAALHFLANGNHTDVVVTAGGGVVALRSLAGPATGGGGGGEGGEQEGEVAAGAFDAGAFCREIRITLGRLPQAVQQQVRQARFGGAEASAQLLWAETRAPLQRMGIAVSEAGSETAARNGHPEPAGAAAEAAGRVLRQEPEPFEFVVPEVNRWEEMLQRFDSKRHRWIVAAAVTAIVLPLLLFFIQSRREKYYASAWNSMQNNVAELDELQQKIRRFRPWFEPTPQNLQVLESLVAAFPEQGDIWAKSIQISGGRKVTCTGFARNQPALLGLLDRLRARPDVTALAVVQFRGDNPIQFSVTYQWGAQHEK